MKKYKIHIAPEADNDILDIHSYITYSDSTNKADTFLEKIEKVCFSLEHFPERGHNLPEFRHISINIYHEIHFKSYRIIYQILNEFVYIHCVLDGRRDLEDLLIQRLIKV